MFNYMYPQATVNNNQDKIESYVFDMMDTNLNYFNHLLDSADTVSGKMFTTYFHRTKNFLGSTVENAKEVIRTGTIQRQSFGKDSV